MSLKGALQPTCPTPSNFNKFTVGTLSFEAFSDRILVEEDEFKTGYECEACNGKGTVTCDDCGGSGKRGIKTCSTCEGACSKRCSDCNGKGALIIAPQLAERRPTTGTVVSVGPGKYDNNGNLIPPSLKVGDKVMFSNFAGHFIDLKRGGHDVTLRILHEPEVLCRMEGHLTLTNFKGKSEIALNEK